MTTTSRAVCLNRISMSDLVMVEREVLEFYADPFAWKRKHDPQDVIGIPDFYSETSFGDRAAEALAAPRNEQSSQEDVQGSIATKQESCPESAPHTETALDRRLFPIHASRKSLFINDLNNRAIAEMCHRPDREQWAALIAEAVNATLTKTPSADRDAGNLRGLAEPNHHQPHALSQGWRDIETAPKDRPVFLLSIQPQESGGFYITGDVAEWCDESKCFVHGFGFKSSIGNAVATHWRELSELGLPI